jgi:hypothetical protein
MYTQTSCTTIRQKMLAGYNLVWNSNTGEVHWTGSRCHSSDHLDRMAVAHEHFFAGRYLWTGQTWQLRILTWDSETEMRGQVTYSNCAFCKPETRAR